MNEEIYYGILMYKVNIDIDIYLFKPQNLVEGSIKVENDTEIFVDNSSHMSYLLITNPNILEDSYDNAVGYAIKESDLLNKYPELDIYRAKASYIEEIFEQTYIGFHDYNNNGIKILKFPLKEVLTKINENRYDEDMTLNIADFKDNSSQKEKMTPFDGALLPFETLKELVEENNANHTQEFIKGIYTSYRQIEQSESRTDLNKQIERILNSEDVEEIIAIIDEIIEYNETLYCALDKLKEQNIDYKEYEYFLNLNDDILTSLKDCTIGELKERLYLLKQNKEWLKNFETIEQNLEKYTAIKTENKQFSSVIPPTNSINIKNMKSFFDERIVGLEEAKRTIISTIVLNRRRKSKRRKTCLFIGPTGSGKTYLAEVASEYLKVPMEIVDMTQVTIQGYIGGKLEDSLSRLMEKAGGDLHLAERGILFFNEIDKKGSDHNSDVSGKGVLSSLLTLFDGTVYKVNYKYKEYEFNTSNLTLLAGGAFTDVLKYKDKKFGFIAESNSQKYEEVMNALEEIGAMPGELLGRLKRIIALPAPTQESLMAILLKPMISPLLDLKEELKKEDGIELYFSKAYLEAVVKKALKLKKGARSLDSIVDESVEMAQWLVLMNPLKYRGIFLDASCVIDNFECSLIDTEGNWVTVREEENKESENIRELKLK